MASTLPTGKAYSRLGNFPLDNSSVFDTLLEAENYALNSPIAYPTQIIGVVEKDDVYIILEDLTLKSLTAGGGDVSVDDLLTSNVNTDEVISVIGTTVGNFKDGDTLPADISLNQLLKMIFQKRIAATYSTPTVLLLGAGSKSVEAGTSIAPALTPTFTASDAGAVTQYKVQKNGVDVYSNAAVGVFTLTSAAIGDESWTFKSIVSYAAGVIKNDNMGSPSPTGAITAGSVNSGNVVYTGQRNTFYGSDTGTAAPTTSAEVRALTGTTLGQSDGGSFMINVPAGTKRVLIAYKATLRDVTSVKYVEQGNAEYKDLFVQSSVTVEGASGFTGVPYKVFAWIIPVPTEAAMTLNVTI